MQSIKKLDIHDYNGIDNWMERFALAASINKDVASNKTAYLSTLMGKEAYDLVKKLAYPKEVIKLDVDEIHKLLSDHLSVPSLEIHERAIFHGMVRNQNEVMRDFLLRLQVQASKCNFGKLLETHLRDQIVAGINHKELKIQLLSAKNLTYQEARKIVETYHNVHSTLSSSVSLMFCQPCGLLLKENHNTHQN
jgi:hypothetical protein